MGRLKYTPSWKQYEKDLHSEDAETSLKAAEKFDLEREHEMKTSAQARRWEESRKAELARLKPEWVKKRIKSEDEEQKKLFTQYLKGGHVAKIKPAPGYVIVKPVIEDAKTKSGIVLPDHVEIPEPNKGIVIGVGNQKVHAGGVIEEPPCDEGDKVLYKFNTLELSIEGVKHNLMGFSDVLGTIIDD